MSDLLKPNFPQFHLACGKDPLRPAMNHIFFSNGYAFASDAHILIKAKLEDFTHREDIIDILEGKYIHRDTWKQIYNKSLIVKDEKLYCMELAMFIEFQEVDKFPNVEAVIPKGPLEDVKQIAFHPINLQNLYKSLGIIFQSGASFKFHGASKAIVVKANDNFYESFGIIMPIMIEQ